MTVYADLQTALATVNTVVTKATTDLFTNPRAGNFLAYTEKSTSSSNLNQVVQPGAGPKLRKWEGAKQFKTFRAYAQTQTCVPYEASLTLKRAEIQYDKSGIVNRKISGFLSDQVDALDRISFAALIANATGLDGVALLSASHPYADSKGSNQSNLSTNSLSLANFRTARNAGMALTYENDEYMHVNYDTLICGPALIQKAREIAEAKDRVVATNINGSEATSNVMDTTTMQNVWQGAFKVIEEPRLVGTYAYYWYLIDSRYANGAKPLILIESSPMQVVALDKLTDEPRFAKDEYQWSVEADLVVAPWAWMSIYGNLATS